MDHVKKLSTNEKELLDKSAHTTRCFVFVFYVNHFGQPGRNGSPSSVDVVDAQIAFI